MGNEADYEVASKLVNTTSHLEERSAVCKMLEEAGPSKEERLAVMQKLVDGSSYMANMSGKDPNQVRFYELGFPGKNQLELVNTQGGAVGHDVVKEKYGYVGFAGHEVVQQSSCDKDNKRPKG